MQRECKWGGYKMIDLILELIRKKAGLYVKSIQQEELAVVFPQLLDTKTNEQEIEQLQKQSKEKAAEKEKYSASIADVIEETAKLEKELQDIEVVYATEKQKMLSIESEILKLEDRLNK